MKQKTQIQFSIVLICIILNWYTLIGQTNSNEVIDENKQLIEKLFDSIAYKSLHLVMKDRAFENNQNAIPNLRNVKLDSMLSIFNAFDRTDRNIDSLYSYTERFIKLRKQYIESDFLSKKEFTDSLEAILSTSLISKSIIKNKGNEQPYKKLISKIKEQITLAINNFKITKIDDEKIENEDEQVQNISTIIPDEKEKPTSKQGFETIIKDYSTILLIILIISLVLNIFLGILFFKIKKRLAATNTNFLDISETTTDNLSAEEIEEITKEASASWIAEFTAAYPSDCIATIKDTLEKSKSELIENIQSNRFSSKRELQKSIDQKLKNSTISLEASLKQCNDRKQATTKIEQELQSHSFISTQVSETISSEEIHTLIERSKRNLIHELPPTINNDQLSRHITEIKMNINLEIEKRVRENLTVYFPFTNGEGAVAADKKSKIKERDSALQFIINPNDTSRATFSLLYDYPDMMQAGIQSYDIFLLPICNLTSENFNRNGTTIEQIGGDGEMTLEGNQWKVVNKVTIKII
ncbi:hypothetical protein [uncultured Aquimarina sp.]|uniref:hypothetical protein n=1 Tax=uncultured Aquimarina sp. TaxID=575652 RepID=UPI002611621A|nr:hypothetical protein [uncultured Aquimarina sp.]